VESAQQAQMRFEFSALPQELLGARVVASEMLEDS
jgi:hypothetical protein